MSGSILWSAPRADRPSWCLAAASRPRSFQKESKYTVIVIACCWRDMRTTYLQRCLTSKPSPPPQPKSSSPNPHPAPHPYPPFSTPVPGAPHQWATFHQAVNICSLQSGVLVLGVRCVDRWRCAGPGGYIAEQEVQSRKNACRMPWRNASNQQGTEAAQSVYATR